MSSKGKRERRTFSEEFERDAVNLIVVEGYSFRAAAEAVNVNENNLGNWQKKYASEPETCGPEEINEKLRGQIKGANSSKGAGVGLTD